MGCVVEKIFNQIEDERLYSPQEVAELFRITKEGVYYWIKTKKVKAVKLGKRWFLEGREIKKLIKTN